MLDHREVDDKCLFRESRSVGIAVLFDPFPVVFRIRCRCAVTDWLMWAAL
jgi:hypothetical protein